MTNCPVCLQNLVWLCLTLVVGVIGYLGYGMPRKKKEGGMQFALPASAGTQSHASWHIGPIVVGTQPFHHSQHVHHTEGSGLTQAAELAWENCNRTIVLEPGTYRFRSILNLRQSLSIVAAVPGTVTIQRLQIALDGNRPDSSGGEGPATVLHIAGIQFVALEESPALIIPYHARESLHVSLDRCTLTQARGGRNIVSTDSPPYYVEDIVDSMEPVHVTLSHCTLQAGTTNCERVQWMYGKEPLLELVGCVDANLDHCSFTGNDSPHQILVGNHLTEAALRMRDCHLGDLAVHLVNVYALVVSRCTIATPSGAPYAPFVLYPPLPKYITVEMTRLTRASSGSKERKECDQDDGSEDQFLVEDLFSVKGAQGLNLGSIEHRSWSHQLIKRFQLTANFETRNSNH